MQNNMNNNFDQLIQLSHKDVISLEKNLRSLNLNRTFKCSELLRAISGSLFRKDNENQIIEPGLDCEILQVQGSGWKKGKIVLTLTFISDDENLDSDSETLNYKSQADISNASQFENLEKKSSPLPEYKKLLAQISHEA